MKVGKWVGMGRDLKAGQSKDSDTNSSAFPSVGDLDWHNSQGRLDLQLEAIWYPCSPINAPQGPHRK